MIKIIVNCHFLCLNLKMFKCMANYESDQYYNISYTYLVNLIIESLSISVQKMIWDEFDIKYVIR